jgi:hypothetical protein
VSDAWMPGAGRIWGTTDGGPLKGGAPRAVWQTLGADPRTVSAGLAAQRLNQLDRACHLVWNPLQGEIVQVIPVLRGGRLLGSPEDLNEMAHPKPGAGQLADVNTEGRLCVQIGVVAFAWDPFTAWPMAGLQRILDWLGSWGIPGQWPAGRPAPFPHGLTTCGDRRLWARGGHFGASQVPGLTAAGPGAVDVDLLSGRATEPRQLERPAQAAARAARRLGAPVPLADERDTDRQAAPAEMGDLYGYLDNDESATAGAVSRVG